MGTLGYGAYGVASASRMSRAPAIRVSPAFSKPSEVPKEPAAPRPKPEYRATAPKAAPAERRPTLPPPPILPPKPRMRMRGVDEVWLASLNPWSMGRKYRNHLLVAPLDDPVWEQRAAAIRTKQETNGSGGGPDMWTYWRGWVPIRRVNGEFVGLLCRTALSYSEWGTYFTLLNAHKGYFDFLWETCGREDKSKPENW